LLLVQIARVRRHLYWLGMKNFLVGLAIGVPAGMLLGDHRQAIAERFKKTFWPDMRGVMPADGSRVAEAVNRIAEAARESARGRNESSMHFKRHA